MRAVIYARFSTNKQSESSVADQFRVCERIADREGFEVVAHYSDSAISGGTTQRPAYQKMLKAARNREFTVIVAEDSSRLWRELSEQWRALKELSDLGIQVVGHGLDTRREESKILLAVSGAMAEAYRDEIARRTRRGMEGRAIAGQATGGKAYGYVSVRDGTTGRIEIHEEQAAIVRRIFRMYTDGASPRTIAATLNADGVPSPGSSWQRKTRRKSGWLASAIHGDVKRGTGILNNVRYIGRLTWGRATWRRGAADSAKRSVTLNGKPLHETHDERLRIIPAELWDQVKARQAKQRQGAGALVRGGLRKRRGGAGRPGKYLLTGVLACGVCGASFVMRNRAFYACASYWHGRACTNSINVSRSLAETVVLGGLREDLTSPELIAETERRVRSALKQRRPENHGKRIAELQREVENLVDAITAGQLRGSPALAKRLTAAEAEVERLQVRQSIQPVATVVPDVRKRFLAMVERLDEVLTAEPESGRTALREVLGERITLRPDASGRFLWAEYSRGIAPLLQSAGASADLMVAGAGFETCLLRIPR